MTTVHTAVAQKIAELSPAVHDKVVEVMVQRELDRRSQAMVQVMDKLSDLEKQLKKLTPDQANYDEQGNKVTEYFSKARIEERDKITGKINKSTKALTNALEKKDFSDVFNLAAEKAN